MLRNIFLSFFSSLHLCGHEDSWTEVPTWYLCVWSMMPASLFLKIMYKSVFLLLSQISLFMTFASQNVLRGINREVANVDVYLILTEHAVE